MTGVNVAVGSARHIWTSRDARLSDAAHVRTVSQAEWVSSARACPDYNFQQSPAYSLAMARLRGATCEFVRVSATASDQLIGVASVRVRTVPLLGGGIAYISCGPLLAEPFNEEGSALHKLLDALVAEYVLSRGLCLRVTLPPTDNVSSANIASVFAACGFTVVPTGPKYRTILVDLRPTMDEIRASLDRKWRNQLSAASKGAVSVELTTDAQAVARFAPLLAETAQRKGFTTELDASFYDGVQRGADADDRLLVAIARENDQDIAGVVASVIGDTAVYVLGATTAASLKSKAAYALHWRVMEAARAAGCRFYDLGGVDPDNNPGVYHFKSGFGGSEIVMPGPFQFVPRGFSGFVSRMASSSYELLKKWRS